MKKAVIIGAGHSGCWAAYELAKEGFDVDVYEEDRKPGMHAVLICTYSLCDYLGFVPRSMNRVSRAVLFSKNSGAELEFDRKRPDLIIDRMEFTKLLEKKARAAGARFHYSSRFLGFSKNKRITVNLKDGNKTRKIETDVLIGADGTLSRVAKAAGLHSNKKLIEISQAVVSLKEKVDREAMQIWFYPQLTNYFFWLIPIDSTKVAIGTMAAKNSMKILKDFLKRFKIEKVTEWQHTLAPSYEKGKISSDSVFLVGDAAGKMKVTTVGGIVSGLRSAKALSKAIISKRSYNRELCGLDSELQLHAIARKILDKFNDNDYDNLLEMMDYKVKRLFYGHTRDELSKMALKLALAQPKFLLFAKKLF